MGRLMQLHFKYSESTFSYFEATRVYLMLGNAGPLDASLVREWMKLDWQAAYPGVTFKSQSEWMSANTDLANGMNQLISTLKEKKDEIRRQRIERGMEEKFSKLTSKELPSR